MTTARFVRVDEIVDVEGKRITVTFDPSGALIDERGEQVTAVSSFHKWETTAHLLDRGLDSGPMAKARPLGAEYLRLRRPAFREREVRKRSPIERSAIADLLVSAWNWANFHCQHNPEGKNRPETDQVLVCHDHGLKDCELVDPGLSNLFKLTGVRLVLTLNGDDYKCVSMEESRVASHESQTVLELYDKAVKKEKGWNLVRHSKRVEEGSHGANAQARTRMLGKPQRYGAAVPDVPT